MARVPKLISSDHQNDMYSRLVEEGAEVRVGVSRLTAAIPGQESS
jgi:hypothetical protein